MKKIAYCCLFLFLFGCASALIYDQDVFFIHPSVKLARLESNYQVREKDGQVFVQVSGISSKNQSVYYKIDWFDKDDMKLTTTLSKWKKVNLIEGLDFNWKLVAPSKKATYYRVYITNDIGNGIIE